MRKMISLLLAFVFSVTLLLGGVGCKKGKESPVTKKPAVEEKVVLADSSNGPGFNEENAFDGDGESTFWETSKPFPHWIQYNFGIPKKISRYTIQTGMHGKDATERMPKDWEFQGSNDMSNWATLDNRINQVDWINKETRTYSIENPNVYKYYRLYISQGITPGILRLYEIRMLE